MSKVFILHGWTTKVENWGRVAQGLNATLLRVPGLTDGTDPVWDLEDYVDWLEQSLPKTPVTLCGHSNGGRIVIAFAAKHPDRVSKLVLVDSAGIPERDFWTRSKKAFFKVLSTAGRSLKNVGILRSILYKLAGVSDYNNATPNMRKTMANLIRVDLTSILPEIGAPTLIIWGANDRVTPMACARVLHAGIRNSRLEIIENAGHSPHISHPDRIVDLIRSFE